MMTKISTIALGLGYVEESSVGTLLFHSDQGYFDSEKKALDSFAAQMFMAFLKTQPAERRVDICYQSQPSIKHSEVETKFCPHCGLRVKNPQPTVEEFRYWLVTVLGMTYDTYPGEFVDWIPGVANVGDTIDVHIPQEAEVQISDIAFRLFPDKLEDDR